MHDVGTFVWVVLVVIGVVSSIVSNARRRVSASPPREVQPRSAPSRASQPYVASPQVVLPGRPIAEAPAPPPQVAKVTRVRPPPRAVPEPLHGLDVFRPMPRREPRWFGGRGALVRAVVAAEVLGRPLALRDWP